jgi:hypothetical protein
MRCQSIGFALQSGALLMTREETARRRLKKKPLGRKIEKTVGREKKRPVR